ncbi:hypothetical protein Hanom_Chr11g01014721 [Helianthus anomalus]
MNTFRITNFTENGQSFLCFWTPPTTQVVVLSIKIQSSSIKQYKYIIFIKMQKRK